MRWVLSVIFFFLLLPSIHAFGMSLPYYENDTLKLQPGQTLNYTITLQNVEDISFDIHFDYSADPTIATFQERDYFIPAKSTNNLFTFLIHIPKDATPGESYPLEFTARPILNQSGQVPFTPAIKRTVTILVVDENGIGYFPKKDYTLLKYLGILVGILLAILVLMQLWKRTQRLSKKIIPEKTPISHAQSVEELKKLLRKMPEEQLLVSGIREIYAKKFAELGEHKISYAVLTAKTKKEIVEELS